MEIEIFKSPGFMSTTDILNILNRDIFQETVLTTRYRLPNKELKCGNNKSAIQ